MVFCPQAHHRRATPAATQIGVAAYTTIDPMDRDAADELISQYQIQQEPYYRADGR